MHNNSSLFINRMLLILFNLTVLFLKFTSSENMQGRTVKSCREQNRPISQDKEDTYEIVDAKDWDQIMLECRFCNEKDDGQPKIWYKQDLLFETEAIEVVLDMNTYESLNRIFVTPEHTLVINNYTNNDSGIYYCHGRNGEDEELKFNYFVDSVSDSFVDPVVGNMTQWKDFDEQYLFPVNDRLRSWSEGPRGVRLRALTEWEPWGKCVVCGRSEGERKRAGRCRMKSEGPYSSLENATVSNRSIQNGEDLLHKFSEMSCYSMLLESFYLNISKILKGVPEYVMTEPCFDTCQVEPDFQFGLESKNLTDFKKQRARYFRYYTIPHGGNLTLVCPGATVETVVTWMKDDAELPSGFETKHNEKPTHAVTVDILGTLRLSKAEKEDAGAYTCFVNNFKILQARIRVTHKAWLSRDFLRHMAYLGFIFLLSFICYVAGVTIAWSRRDTYLGYRRIPQDEDKDVEIQTDLP